MHVDSPPTVAVRPGSKSWTLRLRGLIPLAVSAAFLAWVVSAVSLEKLLEAVVQLNWPALIALTVVYLTAVYLLDSACLWRLFHRPGQPLSYAAALRARGNSYIFGLFHYGLGQAMLIWLLAKAQGRRVTDAALRCVVLAFVDLAVLFSFGLIGAMLSVAAGPHTQSVVVICAIGLAALVGMTLATRCASGASSQWLRQTRVGAWFSSWEWSWRLIGQLLGLRVAFNLLLIGYAIIGFYLCGIDVDATTAVSALPMVALVTALPIS
ncbi:MAG: flippase-like domain-containing protein, partial [Planctomycetes bacterium]|nr:flippase-like domain-containing protein [Planctomycetota bacterium]